MNRNLFLFALIFLCTACSSGSQKIASKDGFAVLPKPATTEAVATFAGGCFWAMQGSMIQLKGVHLAISGYAGGSTVNPTYNEVLSKNTDMQRVYRYITILR